MTQTHPRVQRDRSGLWFGLGTLCMVPVLLWCTFILYPSENPELHQSALVAFYAAMTYLLVGGLILEIDSRENSRAQDPRS